MSKKVIYIAIGILLTSGICVTAFAASILIKTPLAPPLSINIAGTPTQPPLIEEETPITTILISTATPGPEENQDSFQISTTPSESQIQQTPEVPQSEITPSASATISTASEETVETCGRTDTLLILALGIDTEGGGHLHGADAIRLINIDFGKSNVKVVSLSRDLIVSGPLLSRLNIPEMRLGTFYDYVQRNANVNKSEVDAIATNYLAQVIYDAFKIVPDHYITIHMPTFIQLIDTIGGIEVNVPEEYRNIPAGHQILNSSQVIEYIRYPEPSLSAQLAHQDLIITSIRDQLLQPTTLIKVPELLVQFSSSVVTDFSPEEIFDLRCALEEIPVSEINFSEIPEDMLYRETEDRLYPDYEKIKEFLSAELSQN